LDGYADGAARACAELPSLGDGDFRYIADILNERFGISLGEQKRSLVAGRLARRLRELGLAGFREYVERLEADRDGAELSELVDRITTNHSFFFRERGHFDFLRDTVLPGIEASIAAQSPYPLRIWSAGCATGEEVYSIAILLEEYFGPRLRSVDLGLLATDISLAALEEARAGVYAAEKLRETPAGYRLSCFDPAGDGLYAVKDRYRSMVLFKRLNLMSGNFPMRGKFDVIFCRNVMIYFDPASRERLTRALSNYVKPGGYLFIGHSESLPREGCPFEYVMPATYRKGVQGD